VGGVQNFSAQSASTNKEKVLVVCAVHTDDTFRKGSIYVNCPFKENVSSVCDVDMRLLPFQKIILQSSACVAALKNQSCHVTYMDAACHVGRIHVTTTYLRSRESSAQYMAGSCHGGKN